MDYSWLDSDERPGAWMREASCFTFLRSVPPESVIRDGELTNVGEVDLTGREDAAGDLVGSEDSLDTAAFDAGGWTVVYQNNCYPDQLVNTWLASSEVQQGVVVFWNVNAVKEFSLWERGQQVVSFEWPFDREGTDPDRLNADLRALGVPLEEPPDEDEYDDSSDASYAQLMALAERITGVHLDQNFLARPLLAARLNDFDEI